MRKYSKSPMAPGIAPSRIESLARESVLFLLFVQTQCGGIDTETEARGLGTIFEDVTQVRIAAAANGFCADHSVAHVALHLHIFGCDRLIVARPACTGVILRV